MLRILEYISFREWTYSKKKLQTGIQEMNVKSIKERGKFWVGTSLWDNDDDDDASYSNTN